MKPNCRYILKPATSEYPGVYCERPVRYTIEEDDDKRKFRKYKPFCPEHELKAAAMEREDVRDGDE
jgi:hypothetical protein